MIKPLTSLRFFFALMVFCYHLTFLTNSDSSTSQWLYQEIFSEGYLGVSFFFILSGFILALNYQDHFWNKTFLKADFYKARIARIYPLHLLCFGLAIPLTLGKLFQSPVSWSAKAFFNVTLLQSYIPYRPIYLSFNTPSWSISDELFFYLCFPFLVVGILKLLKSKLAPGGIIGILLFLPLLMLIVPNAYYEWLFYINPFFRIFDFILGILLYNLYLSLKENSVFRKGTFVELLALLLLVLFIGLHSLFPEVLRFSVYYWLPMSIVILVFAFQRGWFSRILSHPILILLGEISFGFYMFHKLIISYLEWGNERFFQIQNEGFIILGTLLITLVCSYFSFYYFEKPANRFVKTKLGYKR